MQPTQKKPSIPFLLLGSLLAGYLGYLVNGAWREGIELYEFLETFSSVCEYPMRNYWNDNTLKGMGIALGIYAMVVVMYYTSQRKLMPGKEYGTATLANVNQVQKVLADKDPSFNRILSQNVKMSLNTRKTKLNNNVLIIGGSGAGKTFYEVKPNLMQLPTGCSFICTDPKGGAERSAMKSSGTVLLNY